MRIRYETWGELRDTGPVIVFHARLDIPAGIYPGDAVRWENGELRKPLYVGEPTHGIVIDRETVEFAVAVETLKFAGGE